MNAHDRGIKAVERVREVRERDSRVGLLQALETVRVREAQLARLRRALDEAAQAGAASLDEYAAHRDRLAAMAHGVHAAEQRLDSARTVAGEAQTRWQGDKARLRAIRHLLQERAAQRAEDARRAEVREVDDIVGRLHFRAQAAQAERSDRSAARAVQEAS